eukprot:gene20098-26816_t
MPPTGTSASKTPLSEPRMSLGKLVEHDWVDYATNRDKCLQDATQWSRDEGAKQGRRHSVDYFLFMKPRHRLVMTSSNGSLPSIKLVEDAYVVTERSESSSWGQIGLVSSRVPWRWVGKVHEDLRRQDDTISREASNFEPPATLPGMFLDA